MAIMNGHDDDAHDYIKEILQNNRDIKFPWDRFTVMWSEYVDSLLNDYWFESVWRENSISKTLRIYTIELTHKYKPKIAFLTIYSFYKKGKHINDKLVRIKFYEKYKNDDFDENSERDPINGDHWCHNDDGPAMLRFDDIIGMEAKWYKNGQLHRLDGPAWETIKYDDENEITMLKYMYLQNGQLHRLDGPAKIERVRMVSKSRKSGNFLGYRWKEIKKWFFWNNDCTDWMKNLGWKKLDTQERLVMAAVTWKNEI